MENSDRNNDYIYEVKLFEAFAGIGSQFKALKNISKNKKWKIKSVGYVEWYVDAIIAYELLHHNFKVLEKQDFILTDDITISFDSKKPFLNNKTNKKLINSEIGFLLNHSKDISKNLFDISKVNGASMPKDIDIFTYSFPCQDLSNQGKQRGMEEDSQTRSSLLWQIKRILLEMKSNLTWKQMPKYLLMENVSSIKSHKNINAYNNWKKQLEDIGYESYEYILDSKYFNSPQSRKRVFLLSIHKEFKNKINYQFKEINQKELSNLKLKDILEISNHYESKFNNYNLTPFKESKGTIKSHLINFTSFNSENAIFDINGYGPTLTASGALSRIKLYFGENKIRYLNPIEAFVYMGFTKEDFAKVSSFNLINDNRLIFIMGNSIVVNVLEAIFSTLEFDYDK